VAMVHAVQGFRGKIAREGQVGGRKGWRREEKRKARAWKTRCAPRDDDVLPESLEGAVQQAAEAVGTAVRAGGGRATAEILLPELWDPISGALMADEGDQQKFWEITRYFAELLVRELDVRAKVLYPDMGCAAMLKNAWPDAGFEIGCLADRTPVQDTDELVLIAAPDPQGLEDAKRITQLAGAVPVVLFNPRLVSGDVGIGLNVRRMREQFLKTFVMAYSLRPIGAGSVFRKYPGNWQVFVEEQDTPGRYRKVYDSTIRPQGERLDAILEEALETAEPGDPDGGGPSFLNNVGRTLASMQRFMRSLSQ